MSLFKTYVLIVITMYSISHKKITRPVRFTGARSKTTGLDRNGNGTASSFCSFSLHLRAKVLQIQLANAAPGFVFRRLSSFFHNKNNKINKIYGG